MKKIIVFLLLIIPLCISAKEVGWRDESGSPSPDTDSMKSVNGFGGWLLVTPDKDWEKKWNTPFENVPAFTEAKDVEFGQELTILIFFSNPKAGNNGNMNITCDIQVQRPDKTYSINAQKVACANWPLPPNKYTLMLTQTIIKYVGEEGDLPGEWKVAVTIRDENSEIEVPLKTEFNLIKNPVNKAKQAGTS